MKYIEIYKSIIIGVSLIIAALILRNGFSKIAARESELISKSIVNAGSLARSHVSVPQFPSTITIKPPNNTYFGVRLVGQQMPGQPIMIEQINSKGNGED